MQKKKVTRIFFSMYQSSFFMPPAKEMNIDERFCEEIDKDFSLIATNNGFSPIHSPFIN